jgi:hypothetical protein
MATIFFLQNSASCCVLNLKDGNKQTIGVFDGLFIPFFTVLQEASFIQLKTLRLKKKWYHTLPPLTSNTRYVFDSKIETAARDMM